MSTTKALKEAIEIFELRKKLNGWLCEADTVALAALRDALARDSAADNPIAISTRRDAEQPQDARTAAQGVTDSDAVFASEALRANRWIPVSERLPDYTANECGEPPQFLVMIKGAYLPTQLCFDKDGKWFDWAYDNTFHYYEVTHWRPLLDPPKEAADAGG